MKGHQADTARQKHWWVSASEWDDEHWREVDRQRAAAARRERRLARLKHLGHHDKHRPDLGLARGAAGRGPGARLVHWAAARGLLPSPPRAALARRLMIRAVYARLAAGGQRVSAAARVAPDEFIVLVLRLAPQVLQL